MKEEGKFKFLPPPEDYEETPKVPRKLKLNEKPEYASYRSEEVFYCGEQNAQGHYDGMCTQIIPGHAIALCRFKDGLLHGDCVFIDVKWYNKAGVVHWDNGKQGMISDYFGLTWSTA